MSEDSVAQNPNGPPVMCDGERNGSDRRRDRRHGAGDAGLVAHGLQFGPMLLRSETGIGAIGSSVSEPVEGHGPPRGQPRKEFVVDPVIVGKAAHQDDRWILTGHVSTRRRGRWAYRLVARW